MNLFVIYQRFRGPCCFHHQGDEYLLCEDGQSETLQLYSQHDAPI
jgi:hypothetical protein